MIFPGEKQEELKKVKKLSKMTKLLICLALCFAAAFSAALISGEQCVNAAGGNKYVVEGNVRVQVLSESVIRLELKGSNGFCDDVTLQMAGKNDFNGAEYTVKTSGDKKVVSVGDYNVYIPLKAKSLGGVYVKDMTTRRTVWTYTGNETNSGELPMPADTPDVLAINDCPRIIEPAGGYAPGKTDDPYSGFSIEENVNDIYLIIAQKDAEKLRSEYVKLTGRTNMIPLSAFGLWESRYYEYTMESAQAVVQEYYDHDFYLDNFVIDTDWRRSPSDAGGTGYEVNTDLFPDIAAFFDWMHDRDINVMANDHVKMAPGAMHAFSPEDIAYRYAGLMSLLEKGLDTWWYDRNWGFGLVSPTSKINRETIGMYLYYSVTRQYFDKIAEENGEEYARRAFTMTNVDNIANGTYKGIQNVMSHRYPIQWTGDISSSGASLAQEIANMIKAGSSGIVYESSDLGGHNGKPSSEQYLRWTQYGALSPIYRTHSNNNYQTGRTPWTYGEYETEVVRDYLSMRYHLLPVYYALAHENYETGMPLMRTLEFDYPQYAESRRTDQYLLGENILVAPISNNVSVAPESEFSGLKIAYYNNKDLSGNPVAVKDAKNVAFDWGNNSPVAGVGADNFSAVITGKFAPGVSGRYAVISDDGCRVYIDGKRVVDHWTSSDSDQIDLGMNFEAGRTYDLRIEYFEAAGGAKILLNKSDGDTRTVFIPDGEWIDVWTGRTYTGPYTITVKHGTDTSPIFVKSGSAIALAEDMLNTREKDWSSLAMDWYPSKTAATQSVLYEDDTETLAYQDGKYRETVYGTRYNSENGSMELYINAAKGSFDGERAFTNRNWKVRIHAPNGWGAPSEILLDGKAVTPGFAERDYKAVPFSYNGASPDDDVYEITFESDISKAHVVSVKFASDEREDRPADPEIDSFNLDTVGLENGEIDLSGKEIADYAMLNYAGEISVNRVIPEAKSVIGKTVFTGGTLKASTDALKFKLKGGTEFITQAATAVDGGKFTSTVVMNEIGSFRIYVGGNNSDAVFTVSDNYGNKQTVSFGNTDKYIKAFDVNCIYDGETVYTVEYSAQSGEIFWSGTVTEKEVKAFTLSETKIDRTHGIDFTSPQYSDYVFYKPTDTAWDIGGIKTYKKPGVENSGIADLEYIENGNKLHPVVDFVPVRVDGENELIRQTAYVADDGKGVFKQKVTVNGKGVINVFVGGYKAKAVLTASDPDGETQSITVGDTGTNFYNIIKLKYDVEEATEYTLTFKNAEGYANASYAGLAVEPDKGADYDLNVVMGELDSVTDLTAVGNQDWYYYNDGGDNPGFNPARKNLPESDRLIGGIKASDGAEMSKFWDFKSTLFFSGGIRGEDTAAADITTWSSALVRGTLGTTVKVNGETDYIRLYLSSWHNSGLLKIKENGNVVYQNIVIYCADNAGSGYGRYVDIRVNTYGQEKTLEIEFANVFEKGGTNVALVAMAVGSDEDNSTNVCSNYTVENYEGGDEIGGENIKDWFTFGGSVNRLNGEYFGTVNGSDIIGSDVKEYKPVTINGSKLEGIATAKNGVHIDVKVKKAEQVSINLYTGAWKSTALILVTDENGVVIARESFAAGNEAQYRKFTLNASSSKDQTLRVDVITTARDGNGVTFVAAGNVTGTEVNVHNYKVTVIKEATCLEPGARRYDCVICGSSYEETIEVTDHVYEDEIIAPTCTEEGYTIHTCKYCGDEYTDSETQAKGHSYDKEIIDPTCTEKGYTDYYCVDCGDNYKDSYVDAVGHKPGNWIVDKEATCSEEGSKHKACTVCAAVTETESIPVTAHSFGEWTAVKEASCVETGEEKRVCTACGYEEKRETQAKGHSYETTVTEPTCTEKGYTTHKCTACGDEYTDGETPAKGHSWNDGEVTKQPTTEEEGEKTFTCTECGTTKTEVVAKLEKEEKPSGGSCTGKTSSGADAAIALTVLAALAIVLRRKK